MNGRVLIVDDDTSMCEMLAAGLADFGFETAYKTSADAAFEALSLAEPGFDVVVTDLRMRGPSGLDLCARVVANRPDVPVVVVTAFGSMEAAVAAIRAGAYDFVTKPLEVEALALTLRRAVQHAALRGEVKRLRRAVEDSKRFEDVLGGSEPMRRVYDLLERISDSDASVLITGESGTGKEVLAKALHARGRRRSGPFVAINCAAMPEALLESELFGHARGAFTDAKSPRTGLFVEATGGTIFLDEIGDMPLALQPKLLRALQDRKVRPVGGSVEVPFDARVMAATNIDLETAALEKRFREDLFYRINVIHVDLPPLRARGGDVLVLAQHFIARYAAQAGKNVVGLGAGAAEKLLAYAWPGNVRELQNCIERAIALTRYEAITVDDLPEKIRNYRRSHVLVATDDPNELVSLEEVERRYILRVLEAVGGHRTHAAQILKLDRKTLYRKLERYGYIDPEKPTAGS